AALASRAGLLNGEDGLLHSHLSLSVAGVAGFRGVAFGRARPLAGLALGERWNLDLCFGTENRLLEVELELKAQIRAAKHLRSSALTARENIAEHFPENIAEGLTGAEAAAAPAFEPGVPELVVDRALLGVRQNLVGFLAFFEFVFGGGVIR